MRARMKARIRSATGELESSSVVLQVGQITSSSRSARVGRSAAGRRGARERERGDDDEEAAHAGPSARSMFRSSSPAENWPRT